MTDDLLKKSGIFSGLDVHFADFMGKVSGTSLLSLRLAAALVSRSTREGHICLDLAATAGEKLGDAGDLEAGMVCPELALWKKELLEQKVVGTPGDYKPLVLDDKHRLYLYRYWDYQEKLAGLIRSRVVEKDAPVDRVLLNQGLSKAFPSSNEKDVDWQKVAACAAAFRRFLVISGGPGTGKTTTVARIMALLIEQTRPNPVRIALVSPTGKGASRLQQAIKDVKAALDFPEDVKAAIPEEASTIHRLLGSIPDSPYFRHNATKKLPVDVLVVDEASMVDLALLSKLIQALPVESRLILLGDKDQLASVEAGAVLGDICGRGRLNRFSSAFCEKVGQVTGKKIHPGKEGGPPIKDCVVQLTKNYRFGPESGIAALSRAVNAGEAHSAEGCFNEGRYKDMAWVNLPRPEMLGAALKRSSLEEYRTGLRSQDPVEVFQHFERFRILCALREGPYGVSAVNRMIQNMLREERWIQTGGRWYEGQPLMITRNDYHLKLYNGDIGVVLADGPGKTLKAFFQAPDGTLRKFHPARLPEHETVYAMTVHKSQGSEFDRVLLLLPDRESPVLTRELLYTGITRARKRVEIWGRMPVFKQAVSRRTERASGLHDLLWSPP
jgi:exodeoxyribonuclease V alpha subunit